MVYLNLPSLSAILVCIATKLAVSMLDHPLVMTAISDIISQAAKKYNLPEN